MDEWDWNAVGTHVNFYKGERVLSVTEAAEELNTLTHELAAANAKIEKAKELLMRARISSNPAHAFEKQERAFDVLAED